MDLFISLHRILYPNNKYNIVELNESSVLIDYIYDLDNLNNLIKIKYVLSSNSIKLNIFTKLNSMISTHMERLIESKNMSIIKLNQNTLTEFLFQLAVLINGIYNYCSICGIGLELKGLTYISCCSNRNCISQSYLKVMDNKITSTYKQDPNVFSFLLEILIAGTQHSKGELAFKPLPIVPEISTLDDFKNLISNQGNMIEKNKLIKLVESSSDDFELIEKTNPQIYSILKNAISNNYFSMSSRENINISNSTPINKSCSLKFIHINYSAEIENKFPQKYFLFHGSSLSSWYPIVKNGLKVMSGTAMMANGAVHGDGIYFSDSFQMSWGYSNRSKINVNGYGTQSVVGVFEIMEDPNKWKKAQNIYVINDERVLLLRTLVLANSNSALPKNISDYFLKEIPLQKQTNKLNVNILKNKRLEGEYKKLLNLEFIESMNIQDQMKWIIHLKKIKDLNIGLEIVFSNYPINPPIIKLLNPSINISGLINSSGLVIIEQINPANWKITNNLAEIIKIIHKCFQQSL